MDATVRDAVRSLSERFGNLEGAVLRQGVVASVGAGGRCDVDVGGSEVPAWWLGSEPSVGQTVWCLRQGPVLLVLGALGEGAGFSGALVWKNTSQTVADGSTGVYVQYQQVSHDVGGYWNPATPDRLTVPQAGYYRIVGGVRATHTVDARVDHLLYAPGAVAYRRLLTHPMTEYWDVLTAGVVQMSAGDAVQQRYRQYTGADREVTGGTRYETFLDVQRIG